MTSKNIIILIVVAVISVAAGAFGYKMLCHGGICNTEKECHMKGHEKEMMMKHHGGACCKEGMEMDSACKMNKKNCPEGKCEMDKKSK